MSRLKELAQTAFDRAEQAKFDKSGEPENWCGRCSNSGFEIIKENGYNVARRCNHEVEPK